VAAEPENYAYRDSLGWALFRLGRNDEAITELRRAAVAKEPDGVVFDHLGDVLEKLGRHDEALKSWRQAVAALASLPTRLNVAPCRRKSTSRTQSADEEARPPDPHLFRIIDLFPRFPMGRGLNDKIVSSFPTSDFRPRQDSHGRTFPLGRH